ncbi:MAG: hypothetical protein ACYCW6_23100, partial [Candidatus Xenobia bacterium]
MVKQISSAPVGDYAVSTPVVNGAAADEPRQVVPMAVPIDLLSRDEKTGKIGLSPDSELSSPDTLTLTPREVEEYVHGITAALVPTGTQVQLPDSPEAKILVKAVNAAGTTISVGTAVAIAAHVLAASLAAPLAMASAVGELSEAKQDGVEALHLHKFIKQTREALENLTP